MQRLRRQLFSAPLWVWVGGLLGVCLLSSRAAAADSPPNILWLVSEDNGPFLGCYGDAFAKTPRLDKLATEGVLYLNAFANAPVCAPSRSTLISGVYATTLGTQHMRSRYRAPADIQTYSRRLRDAGYYCMNPGKTDYNLLGDDRAIWDAGKTWKDAPPGRPWMLVLNTGITHESCLHPSTVHAEYLHAPCKLPPYHPDTPEIRSNWVEYYQQVAKMDAWVGMLLDQLERDGLADDTIVFYFSDHGGVLPRSKRFCLDSGLRVPLIVRCGKHFGRLAPAAPGSKLDRLVSFIDFAPTLLSIAGVEVPAQFQGGAFMGPGATAPHETVFGFRNRMDETYDVVRTVRDKRYRYVRNYLPDRIPGQHVNYLWQMPATRSWEQAFHTGKCNEAQSAFWREKPAEELYDEQNDPFEVNNLAQSAAHQQTVERLRCALRGHLLATRDTGFLPESEMLLRAQADPIETMAADDRRYPIARILRAAELASAAEAPIAALIELTRDPDAAVCYWAAVGLRLRKDAAAPATGALLALLQHDSPAVRVAAAETLIRLGHADEGLATLVACLGPDGDPLLSLNAMDALGDAARPAGDAVVAFASRDGQQAWSREFALRKADWLRVRWGIAKPLSSDAPARPGVVSP